MGIELLPRILEKALGITGKKEMDAVWGAPMPLCFNASFSCQKGKQGERTCLLRPAREEILPGRLSLVERIIKALMNNSVSGSTLSGSTLYN